MYKYIVILLSIVLVGCARNNETETPKYSNRTVFFGSAYIEGFGGVCMMADTLTGDGFEVLVPDYLAELIPDVQSTVDMGKTYTDENYKFYTIYGLKGGEYYPTLNIVLDGGARFQAKVKVVNFTDQGWVLESCTPNLQSGWPNIIIGTGAAKKYLCNTTFNPNGWKSWSDISITSENDMTFNFIKDCMTERVVVPYDWKIK